MRVRGVRAKEGGGKVSGMARVQNDAPHNLGGDPVWKKVRFRRNNQTGLRWSASAMRSIARVIAASLWPV